MVIIAFLVFMYINTLGGAAALMFYVSIRNPTRNNLEEFKLKLPKILQRIYFNDNSAAIYSRDARRSGFEFLLGNSNSKSPDLFGLIFYLVFIYGLITLSIFRDPEYISFYILFGLIPIRVAFFGVKIKRDPDSYLPE